MSNRLLLEQRDDIVEWLRQDSEDPTKFVLERVQDFEPTIERNKALYNLDNRGYTPSKNLQHVASIPRLAVEIFKQRYGADPLKKGNEELLERLLNDPDLRYFRTAPGWISRWP